MRTSRFSDERMIGVLKDQEAKAKVADLCRRRGGRKRAPGTRAPIDLPGQLTKRWSLDFVSDNGTELTSMAIVAQP